MLVFITLEIEVNFKLIGWLELKICEFNFRTYEPLWMKVIYILSE